MSKLECNCIEIPCVCPDYADEFETDWSDPTVEEMFWKVRGAFSRSDRETHQMLREIQLYLEEMEDRVFELQAEVLKQDDVDENDWLFTGNDLSVN